MARHWAQTGSREWMIMPAGPTPGTSSVVVTSGTPQELADAVPRIWLDEISGTVEGLRCDGVRDGGNCDGHGGSLFDVGRCETADRVAGRILGLLDGVNLPQPGTSGRVRCLFRRGSSSRKKLCVGEDGHEGLHWVWSGNQIEEWSDEESTATGAGAVAIQLRSAARGPR